MTTIDLSDLFAYDLPEGATLRRLAGDWLQDGYIDDLNRPSRLEVVVIGGKGYVVAQYGYLEGREFGDIRPIALDVDGAIPVGAGGVTFLPRAGEMARIGL